MSWADLGHQLVVLVLLDFAGLHPSSLWSLFPPFQLDPSAHSSQIPHPQSRASSALMVWPGQIRSKEVRTGHLALLLSPLPASRALWKQHRTGPGSGNKGHSRSESPAVMLAHTAPVIASPCRTRVLTGIPEFVLMPAPVTTTTFLALCSALAMSCKSRSDPGVTWTVGILESRFSCG